MKIKYYGTAAAEGWPGLFCRCPMCAEARRRGGRNLRTRSQASVDGRLLIDFPPDTYLHMLFYGLDLPSYRHCIVTHAHEDHLYRDDVAMRGHGFAENTLPGPFTLYGADSVVALLDSMPECNKDMARMAWREVFEFVPFEVEGYAVTPLLAAHGQYGDPKLKCYIYDIERDGERLLYGNDTGIFPQRTWDFIAGRRYDLVSLDCTMLKARDGANHMGIEDAIEVQRRMTALGCADARTRWVITHFSHNGGLLHEELVEIMRPHRFCVAYDGLELDTNADDPLYP